MFNIPDHPEIECAMRTGYPSWGQPVTYFCEVCGEEVEFNECYEDDQHEHLCEYCLLKLHRKR